MREFYKDHKIVITEIEAEWSEDAYHYEISGDVLNKQDECEGQENAIKYAKADIDEALKLK